MAEPHSEDVGIVIEIEVGVGSGTWMEERAAIGMEGKVTDSVAELVAVSVSKVETLKVCT